MFVSNPLFRERERDRGTVNGWKVSGGQSVLQMDTTLLQAAGIQEKMCSI